MTARPSAVLAAAVVGALAFVAYALLCPPVSGMGDGSEFTLILAYLGAAHPTGYPLYTILGHFFGAALHLAGVAWPLAANLWSSAGAAVAMAFLFALGRRLAGEIPGVDPPTALAAAFVPVLAYAFQPVFLPEAVTGEVNSWTVAWTCIAAYTFVGLHAGIRAGTSVDRARERRAALLWGVVCGAGLAHHLTSVLISTPLTVGLLVSLARNRRPWFALAFVALTGALAPLASYGFLAWRAWHPAVEQWPSLEPTFASLWAHVTGAEYTHYLGYFKPADDQVLLITQVALPFLGIGIAALIAGIRRSATAAARTVWLALTTAVLLGAGFTLRYGVPDPAPYFLPAMAIGAAATAPLLAAVSAPRTRGAALRLAALAAASLLVVGPWVKAGIEDRRHVLHYEELIRSMWSAVPADSAIVVWPDDRFLRLREYQLLRGEKPALLVVCPDLLVEPRTRRVIRDRFGVDPIDGFPPPAIVPGSADEPQIIQAYFKRLMRGLNDRIGPPLILFDPSVPIVQRQRKPWERAEASAPAPLPSGHPALR